jgi:hypothetical protein
MSTALQQYSREIPKYAMPALRKVEDGVGNLEGERMKYHLREPENPWVRASALLAPRIPVVPFQPALDAFAIRTIS